MEKIPDFHTIVEAVCRRDRRYRADSYEFVMQALTFTQKKFGKPGHVTGKDLLEGIRLLALKLYGPMARTVLAHWGISSTEDFGNIVFNMIAVKLLSRTEDDTLDDFKNAYDFETAFKHVVTKIAI
jgi:uncharacterized repeat protein (TIGR04138 family)